MSGSGKVPVPRRCVVTGGSGFVGQRLVEMLVDLGAEEVVSFDLAPMPRDARQDPKIKYVQADITDANAVMAVCENKDCVFHVAALVGPYHAQEAYRKVNFEGTKNVVEACRRHKVPKIVMSSSPSTRFPYPDPNVRNLTEDQLREVNGGDFAPVFLQAYAQTKAEGEKYLRDACCDELMTVAVAPHQVYGPRDGLFLPNLLDAAGKGKLMIFGDGQNRISFTHVDNYCHGLILGAKALYPGSPALGKFYIVTDGEDPLFWEVLNEAIVAMGFRSLYTKPRLPAGLMMVVGRISELLGHLISVVTGELLLACLRHRLAELSVLTSLSIPQARPTTW